jgi:hypothetical protein
VFAKAGHCLFYKIASSLCNAAHIIGAKGSSREKKPPQQDNKRIFCRYICRLKNYLRRQKISLLNNIDFLDVN